MIGAVLFVLAIVLMCGPVYCAARGSRRQTRAARSAEDRDRCIAALEAEALEPIEDVIARIDRELAPPAEPGEPFADVAGAKLREAIGATMPRREYIVALDRYSPDAEPGDTFLLRTWDGRVIRTTRVNGI